MPETIREGQEDFINKIEPVLRDWRESLVNLMYGGGDWASNSDCTVRKKLELPNTTVHVEIKFEWRFDRE